MILIALTNSNSTDSWDKEELWIDWLSGYLCRKAFFHKETQTKISLVSSPNIQEKIALIPEAIEVAKLKEFLSSFQDGPSIYLSARSKKVLEEKLKSALKNIKDKELKNISDLGIFPSEEIVASSL